MKRQSTDMAKGVSKILALATSLALITGMISVTTSSAKTAQEINSEVNAALELFPQQVKGANVFLSAAQAVLIIPNIVKAGVGVGGEYGEGAMRIKGKTVEYYSIAAGSIGLQFGAQKKDLILVFKQKDALDKFRKSSGWKAGVDGSVAFIDAGAGKSIDTVNSKDPIVAVLFGQRGLMASATIEGGKFSKLAR